jgi:hypothetical protein
MVNDFHGSIDSKWTCLSLNLMGDPEMPIWLRRPPAIDRDGRASGR